MCCSYRRLSLRSSRVLYNPPKHDEQSWTRRPFPAANLADTAVFVLTSARTTSPQNTSISYDPPKWLRRHARRIRPPPEPPIPAFSTASTITSHGQANVRSKATAICHNDCSKSASNHVNVKSADSVDAAVKLARSSYKKNNLSLVFRCGLRSLASATEFL